MSIRPLAFGVRFRDKGRTVKVRQDMRRPHRYVVEDSRKGRATRQREHSSLAGALKDFASTWRTRLN